MNPHARLNAVLHLLLQPVQQKKLQPVLLRHGTKPLPQELMEETLPQRLMEETLPQQLMEETLPQQLMGETLPQQLMGETLPQPLMGETLPQQLMGETLQPLPATAVYGTKLHATLTMELAQPQCLFLPFSCLRSSPVFCSQ